MALQHGMADLINDSKCSTNEVVDILLNLLLQIAEQGNFDPIIETLPDFCDYLKEQRDNMPGEARLQ